MRLSLHLAASQLTLLSLTLLFLVPRTATTHPQTISAMDKEDGPWVEETLLRAQRGDLMDLPLSPFTGDNSLEGMHYQEGEDGLKRNDALISIAGGLQAVSREKGGFGFRFGRKRWTERGRGDGEEETPDGRK